MQLPRATRPILCFQYREDAEKVMNVLPKRFAKYGLTLHPEKTRLVAFGRNAQGNAQRQGNKPSTFDFLGLTHICARSRRGKFTVHVRTMRKRLRRSLTAVAQWCQEHRHEEVGQQQKTLNAKLRGHYQYYGRPTNFLSLRQFYRGSPSSLEEVAQSSHSREVVDVGEIFRPSPPPPSGAPSHHAFLGYDGESSLRNPLREICTAEVCEGGDPARLRST